MKNKKAIMIKFLVTVLLAIIIFAPACLFASKFFSLSNQAKDNFVNFVNEIKEMETAQLGERKNFILILDEPTAVIYFEKGKSQVGVDVDGWAARDYKVIFEKPSSCSDEKNCLCLFREVNVMEAGSRLVNVIGIQNICEQDINLDLKLNSCGIGIPEDVVSYSCSDGFTIERLMIEHAKNAFYSFDAHYEASRRISLTIEKSQDAILLES
ncbi:hypothetical protein HON71_03265 [Candidatus Woesearchaeota archaeon]|jgi:hypothetical protein|nr:hypothetical protein [Candidatus Woesearchaeota archaeon]